MKGKMKQLTECTKLQQLTSNAQEATTSSQYASLNTPNFCKACSLAKTGSRPSYAKDTKQNIPFLQHIQGDICGPIHPKCGPFKYFTVLVDASTRWTHVALLSTRNAAFSKLLAQIIRLRAHHPDYPIKSIRLDNAGEFTSQAFYDYCMSIGIDVEHPVPHVHTQNGLAEATIKRIQMIARALVMRTNLPTSAWGYAILHAALLIRFRPTASQPFSAYQLVTGYEPDISHLRIFGCAVYVPIAPPQRTKMGPQRRLRGDRKKDFPRERQELSWNVPTLSHFDPRTSQCESEVKRILNLQNVADSIPDAFTDIAKVTRSHIPAANVPARLEVPKQGHNTVGKSVATTHSGSVVEAVAPKRKRGRPLGSVDTRPRKKKESTAQSDPFIINTENPSHEIVSDYSYVHESLLEDTPKSILIPENKEISMNYENAHELMERSSILIDDIFAYTVAHEIIEHDDIEPRSVEECQQRADWPKWKEAIQAELDSLAKRQLEKYKTGSFSDREVKVLAPPRLIFEKVPTFYQLSAAKMKFSAAKLAFALTRRFQNLPKIEGIGFLSVSRRERLLVTANLLEPFEEPEREFRKRNKKTRANKVRPRALIFEMGEEAPMWTARRAAPTVPTNPIMKPNLNKEIPGKLLHMIKDLTFDGKNDSNPIVHLENFVDICDLFKTEEGRDDAIRLRVFPLTLVGEARAWLRSLEPSSITTWEGLRSNFLSRFFPPSKIDKLKADIRSFQQDDGETISEAWERFKHLLNSCPSHGLTKSEQVQTFYSGLAYSSRATLDSSAGGVFMYKTPTEGYKLLEDMLIHNIDWRTDKRLQIPRMAGKISTDFDPSDEIVAVKNQQVGRIAQTLAERTQGELPTQTQVNPKVENAKPMLMMAGTKSKKAWTDIYNKKYVDSDSESEPDYATDYDSEGFTISFEHLKLNDSDTSSDDENEDEDGKQGGYAEFVIPKKEKKGKEKEKEKPDKEELIYIAPIKHDPGSYSLPISCSKYKGLALIDSGAALNMMPSCFCRKMGIKKIEPTDYQYRGVNGYMTKPLGIAEAVPIRIGNFVYYTDFIIANLPKDTEIPIILGRAFLHTAQVNTDMRNQVTSMGYGENRLYFDPNGEPVRHLDEPYEDPSLTYKKVPNRPLLPHEQMGRKKTEDYPNPIQPKEISTNPGPSKKEHRKKRGNHSEGIEAKIDENRHESEFFKRWKQKDFANAKPLVWRREVCPDQHQRQRTRSSTSSVPNFRAPGGGHVFTYFGNDPTLNDQRREHYRKIVDRLASRQILVPRRVDWDLLQVMGMRNEIRAKLEKHAYDEEGSEYFICHAWERIFDFAETLYRELILEFVATFRFEEEKALDEFYQPCMSFRLGGVWHSISLVDLAVALGIYTQAEVEAPGFVEYMFASGKRPDDFDPSLSWAVLGSGNYGGNLKVKSLLSSSDRLYHRMLVNAVNARSSSEEKISTYDLWLLEQLTTDDKYLNAPYIVAMQLMKGGGYREGSRMAGGQYVTRLARHYGVLTDDAIASMTSLGEMGLIDMEQLRGMGAAAVDHLVGGDQFTWIPYPQTHEPRRRTRSTQETGEASGANEDEQPTDEAGHSGYEDLSNRLSEMQLTYGRHHQHMEYNTTEALHQANWQSGLMNRMASQFGVAPATPFAASQFWPFSDDAPPGYPTFEDWPLQDLEVKSTLGASSGGNHLSPLHLLHSSFSPPLLLEERKAPNPRVLAWISLGSFSLTLAWCRCVSQGVTSWYQSFSLSELGNHCSMPRLKLSELVNATHTLGRTLGGESNKICMANTRSQTGAARGPPDQTASTADQQVRVETVESPPRLQVLGGGPEHVPRVNLDDREPVLTEVTPEMRMFDNVMKAVNEAMSKQQESFMKMLEDRDTSNRRHETVGENAATASGDAEVVVVTEETRVTGDKEKEKGKAKGCSYKNFLGCKPPEFRGCTDPVVCLYWLREMEMAFEASECDSSQRVKFASHLLKGEALTWWNLTRSSLTPEVYARLSWAEFKKKMLEKYCSERALDKIEDEFRGLKKGNNPISFYAKDFMEKLGMVEHLAPDEKAKIKAYSRGLPAEIRSAVRIARVTTLHEAIEESLRIEDDITQARVEGYQAGQKRKFEEAAMSARPSKTFQDGKRGGNRVEAKWCNKCRSKHYGPCRSDSR
ncbi:hypothetical protein OSB04_032123 [Centaurea solstitialis]|uniref:Integrase catalytic domain-containing protein n=1 Tax=Centaurea solstitialis TaxID=347529 RepID=A0AA38W5E7_9ASTR|nr:hypothetical protein OSB04_032123 [Centaurea solstitialis]